MTPLEPVAFPAPGGLTLRGVLHRPLAKSQPGWAALLLPGLAGPRYGPHRLLFDLAEVLSQEGITVLRLDLSGGGYSYGDETSFGNHVAEARCALAWLRRKVDAERLLIGGICRGAKVALAAACGEGEVERLLLLSCPPFNEATKKKQQRRRFHHLKTYGAKFARFDWLPRLLRGDLRLDLIRMNLTEPIASDVNESLDEGEFCLDAGRISGKALFLYGESDPDLKQHLAFYQNLFAETNGAALRVIPGSDAGFYAAPWHHAVLEAGRRWWQQA
ncbi:hypothetical protein HQ520_18505 [bacterium]|nr:hypothetical protein [bacterium]